MSLGRLMPQTAAAALALGTAGTGWLGWEWWQDRPNFTRQLATARGQRTQVDLPDGSRVDLDTATQATVRFYRDRREVALVEGQVMFSIQADPDSPFHVVAGDVRVTVVGTRFSVRHTQAGLDAGQTRVAVEHGRVRVARLDGKGREVAAGGAGSLVDLTRGQAVVADAQGSLGPVEKVAPGEIAPWQAGRINFEATPLAQALAEFGRYGAAGVVIRDPAIAGLQVGGSFNADDFSSFLRALPTQLPVRLRRRNDQTELVGAR
jgi:transmembrane sensor